MFGRKRIAELDGEVAVLQDVVASQGRLLCELEQRCDDLTRLQLLLVDHIKELYKSIEMCHKSSFDMIMDSKCNEKKGKKDAVKKG